MLYSSSAALFSTGTLDKSPCSQWCYSHKLSILWTVFFQVSRFFHSFWTGYIFSAARIWFCLWCLPQNKLSALSFVSSYPVSFLQQIPLLCNATMSEQCKEIHTKVCGFWCLTNCNCFISNYFWDTNTNTVQSLCPIPLQAYFCTSDQTHIL